MELLERQISQNLSGSSLVFSRRPVNKEDNTLVKKGGAYDKVLKLRRSE